MDKLKKNLLDIYTYNKKLIFLFLGLLIALFIVLFYANSIENKEKPSLKTEYVEKLVLFGNDK